MRCDLYDNHSCEDGQAGKTEKGKAGPRLRRGRAFTQAGSSTVSAWIPLYRIHTFSKRSSHRPVSSRSVLLRLYFLATVSPVYKHILNCISSCALRGGRMSQVIVSQMPLSIPLLPVKSAHVYTRC